VIGVKFVVSVTVVICKVEHFIGVVPAHCNVSRHHSFGQWFLTLGLTESGHSIEDRKPFRENNGC